MIRSGGESRDRLGTPQPPEAFLYQPSVLASWLLAWPCPPACIHQAGTCGSPPPATCWQFWGVESSGFALPVWQQGPSFVHGVTVSSLCSAAGQPSAGGDPAQPRLGAALPGCAHATASTMVSEGPGTGSELCLTQQHSLGWCCSPALSCLSLGPGQGADRDSTNLWAVSLALKNLCSLPWLLSTQVSTCHHSACL